MILTVNLGEDLERGAGLLRLPRMTDKLFVSFCERNPDLRVERSAKGNLILMAPADYWTESRGDTLLGDLINWNRALISPGKVAGSSAGFTLPDGSVLSPDTSWISNERWQQIPPDLRRPFPHVSPEFIVEVMSPSDSLAQTKRKMVAYMTNDVLLGWLIDRKKRTVYIYRPGQEPQIIVNPETLSADPELPGFVANLQDVFAEDTL